MPATAAALLLAATTALAAREGRRRRRRAAPRPKAPGLAPVVRPRTTGASPGAAAPLLPTATAARFLARRLPATPAETSPAPQLDPTATRAIARIARRLRAPSQDQTTTGDRNKPLRRFLASLPVFQDGDIGVGRTRGYDWAILAPAKDARWPSARTRERNADWIAASPAGAVGQEGLLTYLNSSAWFATRAERDFVLTYWSRKAEVGRPSNKYLSPLWLRDNGPSTWWRDYRTWSQEEGLFDIPGNVEPIMATKNHPAFVLGRYVRQALQLRAIEGNNDVLPNWILVSTDVMNTKFMAALLVSHVSARATGGILRLALSLTRITAWDNFKKVITGIGAVLVSFAAVILSAGTLLPAVVPAAAAGLATAMAAVGTFLQNIDRITEGGYKGIMREVRAAGTEYLQARIDTGELPLPPLPTVPSLPELPALPEVPGVDRSRVRLPSLPI